MFTLPVRAVQYIKTALCCLLLVLTACSEEATKAVFDIHGTEHNLTNLEKNAVLTYWAEWCTTCRSEMPHFNALHDSGDIDVYGVYYDKYASDARVSTHAIDMGITFPVLADHPDELLNLPDINGVPTLFILKTSGDVIGPLYGPQSIDTIMELSASGA